MAGYQFVNFTAADRKRNLIPFGYFNVNDSISWIAANDPGITLAVYTATGTVDGVNRIFTVPFQYYSTLLVYKNGVLQVSPQMYTVSGLTVTFAIQFTPQVGDLIQVLES